MCTDDEMAESRNIKVIYLPVGLDLTQYPQSQQIFIRGHHSLPFVIEIQPRIPAIERLKGIERLRNFSSSDSWLCTDI